jgi:acetyl esterase/lipase
MPNSESDDILRQIDRIENEAFTPAPGSGFVERSLEYGRVGDRQLRGIIYVPKKESGRRRPAVVYVHGGGWRGGKVAQFSRHAAAMTERDFVGLCIGYRYSGEATFPASIQDCKCAVRYLRANAEHLRIDAGHIGIVGGSAGAHLSALVATTPSRHEWLGSGGHADHSSAVQAAVLFNGTFDLPALWRAGKCTPILQALFGKTYEENPEVYKLASPITHVDANTPPCLLLHGEEDGAIPVQQSVDFRNRLQRAGVSAELIRVPGVDHGWFNHDPHYEPCLRHMMDFLTRNISTKH